MQTNIFKKLFNLSTWLSRIDSTSSRKLRAKVAKTTIGFGFLSKFSIGHTSWESPMSLKFLRLCKRRARVEGRASSRALLPWRTTYSKLTDKLRCQSSWNQAAVEVMTSWTPCRMKGAQEASWEQTSWQITSSVRPWSSSRKTTRT